MTKGGGTVEIMTCQSTIPTVTHPLPYGCIYEIEKIDDIESLDLDNIKFLIEQKPDLNEIQTFIYTACLNVMCHFLCEFATLSYID